MGPLESKARRVKIWCITFRLVRKDGQEEEGKQYTKQGQAGENRIRWFREMKNRGWQDESKYIQTGCSREREDRVMQSEEMKV